MNFIPLNTLKTPMNSFFTLGNLKDLPAFEAGYTLKDTHREYAVKGIRCLNQNIIMKDLTNQRTALRSLFKHLTDGGFSIKSVEPQDVEEDDDILLVTKITTFDGILDHYFVYDDDYILTVEKDGKTARILQTWFGGVEGLFTNASSHKDIYDDLDKVSEDWYNEMEAKDIQFFTKYNYE